jgi:hypothetical protein
MLLARLSILTKPLDMSTTNIPAGQGRIGGGGWVGAGDSEAREGGNTVDVVLGGVGVPGIGTMRNQGPSIVGIGGGDALQLLAPA